MRGWSSYFVDAALVSGAAAAARRPGFGEKIDASPDQTEEKYRQIREARPKHIHRHVDKLSVAPVGKQLDKLVQAGHAKNKQEGCGDDDGLV